MTIFPSLKIGRPSTPSNQPPGARDLLSTASLTSTASAAISARDFRTAFSSLPEEELHLEREKLAHWARTPEATEIAYELLDVSVTAAREEAGRSHPAHDYRHIVMKDPLVALELSCLRAQENPLIIFSIIPSLLHDIGRAREHEHMTTNFLNAPAQLHAELGFSLAEQILRGIDMPALLRKEILFAVLEHNNGFPPQSSLFHRSVRHADAEQLIGVEGFSRAITFDIALGPMEFSKGGTIVRWLENFTHAFAPPLMRLRKKEIWQMLEQSKTCLRILQGKKGSFGDAETEKRVGRLRKRCSDEELLHACTNLPGCAPLKNWCPGGPAQPDGENAEALLNSKFHSLSKNQQDRVALCCAYVLSELHRQDRADLQKLKTMAEELRDPFLRQTARSLRDSWISLNSKESPVMAL